MKGVEDLKEFLLAVVKRPAMYHVNSVNDLSWFVLGFQQALTGSDLDELVIFMNDFRRFVNETMQSDADHAWHRLILFNSSDDAHSVQQFGALFTEFIESRTA